MHQGPKAKRPQPKSNLGLQTVIRTGPLRAPFFVFLALRVLAETFQINVVQIRLILKAEMRVADLLKAL